MLQQVPREALVIDYTTAGVAKRIFVLLAFLGYRVKELKYTNTLVLMKMKVGQAELNQLLQVLLWRKAHCQVSVC